MSGLREPAAGGDDLACPRHGGRVGRNSLYSIRTGAGRLQISTLPVRRTGGS
jgi:hypothetical protein